MGELLIERDEKLLNQYYENFQKSLLENEKFWKRKIAKLQERMIKSGHDIYVIQLLNCNGAGEETKNQKIWYLLEEKAKKLQKDNEENLQGDFVNFDIYEQQTEIKDTKDKWAEYNHIFVFNHLYVRKRV